ncbi:MAG: hypothetical protein M5R38_03570 [Candidatus Methylomirabilis sp.]|nr:hypothetical protein [Candidatus Methylomirabilis sp.]
MCDLSTHLLNRRFVPLPHPLFPRFIIKPYEFVVGFENTDDFVMNKL